MKCVFVSSPLIAVDNNGIERHKIYAARCVWDSLRRGEAPYAPHLFLCQKTLLDDLIPHEREMGMKVGLCWGRYADLIAVYVDFGISNGMQAEIDAYRHMSIPIEIRHLEGRSQEEPKQDDSRQT